MTFLYTLVDPQTYAVRWVGITVRPIMRKSGHVSEVTQSEDRRGANARKDEWIRNLLAMGLRPTFRVLTILEDDEAASVERRLISRLPNLLNSPPGGLWTQEKKDLQSRQVQAEWDSGVRRDAIQATWTPEKRAAHSDRMTNVLSDPGTRERISSRLRTSYTPERRQRMSEALQRSWEARRGSNDLTSKAQH
jgi:hypothetical protein